MSASQRPYIGMMSGTSLDGVDAVLADLHAAGMPVRAHVHLPFTSGLRSELLALNTSGADELHRMQLAANALVKVYAQAVATLLTKAGLAASQVCAIGAHGQTVRHRPGAFDGTGYTAQLMNGALLAELTGIDVVCDFRSRDVAAGGQGAPLVPAFHVARLGNASTPLLAVVNIGGMANVTLLPQAGPVLGFDTGPGNVLMDLWCQRHTGHPYDLGGVLAARGKVDSALLAHALSDAFFSLPPPKSTGRDHFHAAWLDACLSAVPGTHAVEDVQATLTALTAHSIANAVKMHAPNGRRLWVCGGGAFNNSLMQDLQTLMPEWQVSSTQAAGLPPDHVEALAFAWLAQRFMARDPGNLVSATGARGPRVLGALYPA